MAKKTREDVLAQIQALMNLADDSTAPDGEREQATRTISRLINTYKIEQDEIRKQEKTGPAEIVDFELRLSNRYGLGGVRAQAIHRAVLIPLGGKSINWHSTAQSTKDQTRMVAFVSEDVVDFAKALIASLILQMETGMFVASRQHQRELTEQWLPTKDVTRLVSQFRKGYLSAWGTTVGNRVAMGREDARKDVSASTGKEIVLVDDTTRAKAAQELWLKEQYGNTKLRTARAVRVSRTGKMAGARDGRTAQLGINEIGGRKQALSG